MSAEGFSLFSDHLESSRKQLAYYKQLGESTFAQLSDEQLLYAPTAADNSIAVIVKHLWGNMMSRWTDFLTTDGEKTWRQRDQEFEVDTPLRAVMMAQWQEGWATLFSALDSMDETNYRELAYIRNQGHTVTEAINRQLCHYAYHIGQIVLLGRMQRGDEWQSLSIPKGASAAYNKERFDKEKGKGHFTDEL